MNPLFVDRLSPLAVLLVGFCLCSLASSITLSAATLPSDWRNEQHFELSAPGLIRLSLPLDSLDAARPALEDLRLYEDAGNEMPYLIDRPVPVNKIIRSAAAFQVALNPAATLITFETGLSQPLDGVTLETPANDFLKSVQVEGSADGKRWQTLVQAQPIFRQSRGASQLHLSLPVGTWTNLRLTVDDQRSQPIPFTGARVHAAASEPVPSETLPVIIAARHENPGETRLALNLGAAHLDLSALSIETTEPLFTRQVTLAVPQISQDAIREQVLTQGVVYRVAVEGQPASSNLTVTVGAEAPSREMLLLIANQDSPPLPITAVRAERRPVFLVFLGRAPGLHHLLTGNGRCAAPRYDLSAMRGSLKAVPVSPITISPLADNPSYRPPEALAGIQEGGTALDVSNWRFRKAIKLDRAGAQQIELDLDVLSGAQPGLEDLRLLRSGKQLPYILQRTSINRSLTPTVSVSKDAKDPGLSRWTIKLPKPALPITRLTCLAQTPLFRRDLSLYEELADERGDKYRRNLGGASWTRTPERASQEFALTLDSLPQTDTLFLETHNGDNPAIELDKFQLFYPATRVLFKAQSGGDLFLYYGNPDAGAPRYDLSLVASELLAAEKTDSILGGQEQLKKAGWRETQTPGKGGLVFWGILALVVVVLLILISRLLPKPQE